LLSGHDGDEVGVPVAVISGLPGAGKTTLALQVAHKARSEFPDGQLWVHLEGATDHPRDPGEVLGELVRALGVQGSVIPMSTPERADKHGLATALYWRAVCDWNLGAYADARQSAEQAIHLARSISDRQTELLALRIRAIALANLPGQREEAVASAEQARALATGLGHATLEHEILHSTAYVYNLTGRHEVVLQLRRDGLALERDLGVQAQPDWLCLLGDAYHGLGRYSEAAESLRSALPFYRDRFMRRHHALCLLKMGYAYQAMGDYQAAISHLGEAWTSSASCS